jgi:hypothetical protein
VGGVIDALRALLRGERADRAARRRIALAVWAVATAGFALTAAREIWTTHTPYNHFALLAEGWLRGRLDLGGPPPAYTGNNDFASFDGKHYVSFPPFPAVLLLPLVALLGGADRVPDGAFFVGLAGVAPGILFLALERLALAGRSARTTSENAAFAIIFAFGSIYWFSALQGTVWFAAHVVGAALASAYLLFSIEAERPALAGLCFGLAFATRTPVVFAVPLFLFEAWRVSAGDRAALLRRLVRFALPASAVLAALLAHNAARFGEPLEFGHALLTVAWRARIEKWGLFSYHYLGRNLAIVLASLPYRGVDGAPFQINGHGLALWITTPAYAWALWPRRASATFLALAATAGAIALPSLLYQNSGWLQFGYRFSNDFAPFLFAMIALSERRLGRAFWTAACLGVVVNAFGALTFQRAGHERFYFVDRTQKILFQPD